MHYILDNGHGGVNEDGIYTTAPNWDPNDSDTWHKMWVHDGVPLFEGEFNREVVQRIGMHLEEAEIPYTFLVPECDDISLDERIDRASQISKWAKDPFLISVHGNAFNTSAWGFEIFTSRGLDESDPLSEFFAEEFEKMFPTRVMRFDTRDGFKDKEANFKIFRVPMPSILTENFFFDHPSDAKLMMSDEGLEKIALAHFKAILRIEGKEK